LSTRSKRRRGVWLPWERRALGLRRLLGSRRWSVWLLAAVVSLVLWKAWKLAEHAERVRVTRTAIAEVRRAVETFQAETQRCPRSTVELVHPPQAGARYLDELPLDGWDRPLHVRCPGRANPEQADVISAGKSGSLWVDDNID
jgi:hypothetical protein